jgi:hypothetical protein
LLKAFHRRWIKIKPEIRVQKQKAVRPNNYFTMSWFYLHLVSMYFWIKSKLCDYYYFSHVEYLFE